MNNKRDVWTHRWINTGFGGKSSYTVMFTNPYVGTNHLYTRAQLAALIASHQDEHMIPMGLLKKALKNCPATADEISTETRLELVA